MRGRGPGGVGWARVWGSGVGDRLSGGVGRAALRVVTSGLKLGSGQAEAGSMPVFECMAREIFVVVMWLNPGALPSLRPGLGEGAGDGRLVDRPTPTQNPGPGPLARIPGPGPWAVFAVIPPQFRSGCHSAPVSEGHAVTPPQIQRGMLSLRPSFGGACCHSAPVSECHAVILP